MVNRLRGKKAFELCLCLCDFRSHTQPRLGDMADFAADTRCPRCAKHFQNQMAVLAHLNQPSSACRLRDALFQAQKRVVVPQQHPQSQHSKTNQTLTDNWNWAGNVAVDMEIDPVYPTTVNSNPADPAPFSHVPLTPSEEFVTEEHENAAKTYGIGKSFMDKFDEDKYAKLRNACPYYPFSTKEEWELAAYLLESDLSMASIDRFLKLSLVSSSPLLELILTMYYRSNILDFHSIHPKIYAVALSFFLQAPNGSTNRGKPSTPPSILSDSSFVTLSNVYSLSWIAH